MAKRTNTTITASQVRKKYPSLRRGLHNGVRQWTVNGKVWHATLAQVYAFGPEPFPVHTQSTGAGESVTEEVKSE